MLNFLGAEINYRGGVTDDKDVRLIKAILRQYIKEDIINEGCTFSTSGIYNSIAPGTQDDYLE